MAGYLIEEGYRSARTVPLAVCQVNTDVESQLARRPIRVPCPDHKALAGGIDQNKCVETKRKVPAGRRGLGRKAIHDFVPRSA